MNILEVINRLLGKRPASSKEQDGKKPAPDAVPNLTVTKPLPSEWKRIIDRHLNAGQLPPDDVLPLIRQAFLEELAAPLDAIAEKRDALFCELISDFAEINAKFGEIRKMLPVTPLELRFYHRNEEDDDPSS